MIKLIICDIDGTLADCSKREHLAAAKDWDGFHALMHEDEIHTHVLDFLLQGIPTGDHQLLFLTGRPEEYRAQTTAWLAEKCSLFQDDDYLELIMRPRGDFTPDSELKSLIFQRELESGVVAAWLDQNYIDKGNPAELRKRILFLEDRERVVAMWRDLGYTCWQTANGAF